MQVKNLTKTECSKKYHNMYNRCYNEKVHELKPWYKGTSMCELWLDDKYTFYDWVNDGNFYEIEGEPTVELDHNILVKGNTVYSPETCVFAPKSINTMISGISSKNNNGLPAGVIQTKNGKYKPLIKGFHDIFDKAEEAWNVYAEYTKAKIITKADEYYGKIPMKLYEALWNYKIEMTD